MAGDIVDDVNALLKLGVGDMYRLEHIKQAYMANKTIWESDSRYMEHMRRKYLSKIRAPEPEKKEEEDRSETIHCWKCGRKNELKANFCMACGSSLFEIEQSEAQPAKAAEPRRRRRSRLKKPLLIIIPVIIILVLVAAAASQGYIDTTPVPPPPPPVTDDDTTNSKCGPGTMFDEAANSCVLATHSKCGAGTVFNPATNSCVLG